MRTFHAEFVSHLRMGVLCLAIACSLAIALAPARADEPPAKPSETKSDAVDEAAYAAPKLKFVEVDKPYVVDAAELDPELANWITKYAQVSKNVPIHPRQPQFAVVLQIVAPLLQIDGSGIEQSELANMLKVASEKRPFEGWISDFFDGAGSSSLGPLLPAPDENHPRPRYLGYLRISQQRTDMRSSGPRVLPWRQAVPDLTGAQEYVSGQRFYRAKEEVYFLATTKERAEELAKAFLVLVNQGKALPGRIQSLAWKKSADAELIEAQTKLAAAQGELDKQGKALKSLGDAPVVSSDTLKELKTKKVLLSVDRAGVAARVAAAEKMMKAALDSPAGLKSSASFMSVKESAEIELAGLTGQTVEIDRLIDNSGKRIAVERDRTVAIVNRNNALAVVQKAEAIVAAQEANIKATAPVELLHDAIVIRPVQLKAEGGK